MDFFKSIANENQGLKYEQFVSEMTKLNFKLSESEFLLLFKSIDKNNENNINLINFSKYFIED